MDYFISLEEALNTLDKNVMNLGVEKVKLIDAIGRRAAENIYSCIESPPFHKSAMDGYAVKLEDSINLAKVKIIDKVFAGDISENEVLQGTAIRIMTGAMVPKGTDAVIKQEDVEVLENNFIKLNSKLSKYENVCFKGEDINKGSLLVEKGKKLDYADIGVMTSSGIDKVNVYKVPRIALISTGNEILDVTQKLQPGKIYNSNKYTILGRLKELGYKVEFIEHMKDESVHIGNKIKEISKDIDIIITTGGASVGEKDLLKESIDEAGGEKLFWKVKLKPGSAVLCSKLNNKIIISLSGNPTAALTSFELLVRTTLDKLSGKEKIEIVREKAYLVDGYDKKGKQRKFLRGRVCNEQGKVNVYITQVKKGNGILSSNIKSNCIIEIGVVNEEIPPNTLIDIIKL